LLGEKSVYNPKISIVIPAYNASNYLAEAIDSALAQTYSNYEIIVVNDGSKDDGATERVALSYGDKIRYFYKENGGSSSALNVGIENMTGEWFSWLSHDDLYMPEKLEKQIEYINFLNIDPSEISKHVFFAASELIDAEGHVIRPYDAKKAMAMSRKLESVPHNGHLICEPTEHNFHGCSCLIHRDAFKDVGCFDEKLRLLNDIDLWFRFYSSGYKVHYIPASLVQGRVHGAQVSISIGYSYHNPEQDMFWNRSLDFLLEHYSEEKNLLFLFARNAYLKTRTAEGDRAFENISCSRFKKISLKLIYSGIACSRSLAKKIYLKLMRK
jgi:glycosyltransferase involved in cell wall biosynthesis